MPKDTFSYGTAQMIFLHINELTVHCPLMKKLYSNIKQNISHCPTILKHGSFKKGSNYSLFEKYFAIHANRRKNGIRQEAFMLSSSGDLSQRLSMFCN